MRILILGGTGEALQLAKALVDNGFDVVSSLAGRTTAAPLPGRVRIGGFGGPAGLADYLRTERIHRLIDATHPFAARISAHAAQACEEAGIARLMLVRPCWQRQAGDLWHEAASMAEAAARLPGLGKRALLTIGINELAAFQAVPVHCVVRLITAQPLPLADYAIVTGTGSAPAAEAALMIGHRIDVLVTKASGGAATYGKIQAARDLGLPVLMVTRPELPHGERVDSVAAAISWATSPAAAHGYGPAHTAGNR